MEFVIIAWAIVIAGFGRIGYVAGINVGREKFVTESLEELESWIIGMGK